MSTSRLLRKFDKIAKDVDHHNSRTKTKRFQTMTNHHNHRVVEVGVYDTVSKKWALTDVRAHDAPRKIDEMEDLIRNPR